MVVMASNTTKMWRVFMFDSVHAKNVSFAKKMSFCQNILKSLCGVGIV